MSDALARLKAANAELERRDASLREELHEKRDRARVAPEGGRTAEAVGGQAVSSRELAQESIVRKTGRPVLAIFRNEAQLNFETPDSLVWRERLERARSALTQAARAIGRIEVTGHESGWLGTGWLVAPDIVVTNRHVAAQFGRGGGDRFVFRQGLSGAAMTASIDFLEDLPPDRRPRGVALSEILYIEDEGGPDLAFLRVRPGTQALSAPIGLASSLPQLDEAVAVIGYPARDPGIPDLDLMERIYGRQYDTKRLAPGQIMLAGGRQLQHDCTTLGGNSGSAVISLTSGDAVGLHYAGTFLTANYAVAGSVVQERLERLSRPRATVTTDRTATLRDAPPPTPPAVRTTAADGLSASFTVPINISVSLGAPTAAAHGDAQPVQASVAVTAGRDTGRAPAPARPDTRPLLRSIPWSADLFSRALTEALARHDVKAVTRLMTAFERQNARRTSPYPALFANLDLAALREKRQFAVMRRYAEAVLVSGTKNMRVHRQYGQALIELGEFDAARRILEAVAARGDVNRGEEFEARGLIGRSFKQEYVNAPDAPGAGDRLRRAIDAYQNVYDRDASMLWHGINMASCHVRAQRDSLPWADLPRARQIAGAVLERIATLESEAKAKERPLDVWDYATRVEAFVVLQQIQDAEASLKDYLSHPQMSAFEVSSTHRQFSEVLRVPADTPIMRRLSEAVERFRGGGALHREATPGTATRRSVLIRVSDPNWQPSAPDVTVRSRSGNIVAVEGPLESVRQLLKDQGVISIEESRPGGTVECVHSVPWIKVTAAAEYVGRSGTTFTERGGDALIAVIDNGIDIHHEAFRGNDGTSRIVGIWDQTGKNAAGMKPPSGFNYGDYYDASTIDAAVRNATDLAIGRNPEGHGTHVASIAAGRKCGQFGGGVAPEASLLIVITDSHGPIGYSVQHADALAFIDAEAERLNLPVVVNLSQGLNAGAHDGKSPLEGRFNAFCSARPGRVVVKSAGNEGQNGGHAKFGVGQGDLTTLNWRRLQGATLKDEYVELWWSYGNELEFRLCSPSGVWSEKVTLARLGVHGQFARGATVTTYDLELVTSHPDQGDCQLRIHLGGDPIETGLWQLEILGRSVSQEPTIHAWIERGDPFPSKFETHATSDTTVTIPGTAEYVITVGAVKTPGEGEEGIRPWELSSSGPTRTNQKKPDVAAPGVDINAACGGTPQGITAMAGTSMAAPHVTGAVALVLSQGKKANRIPTAMQIAVALRQHTLRPPALWTEVRGYGVVNVTSLLKALC